MRRRKRPIGREPRKRGQGAEAVARNPERRIGNRVVAGVQRSI